MTLPDTYKQVEYIQSSGTQYINTGYIPNQNTKLAINMGGWSSVSQYTVLFGARKAWTSSASDGLGFMVGWNNGGSQSYGMFGGSIQNLGPLMSFTDGSNHSIELSQSGIYQDGILKQSLPTVTFTSPGNLYIFAENDNGTLNEISAYKFYSCKIRDNGTLVRDLVPVLRKSDNKPGLYDLVNNVFYTNQGTGEFSYPAQSGKIKRIYVGDKQVRPAGWKPGANTVAYYPFTSTTTVNDQSGNSRNLTNTNVTFGTNQGVSCASFNGTNSKLNYSSFYNLPQGDYVINLRAYKLTQTQSHAYIVDMGSHSSSYKGQSLVVEYDNNVLRFAFWYDDCDASVNPVNTWTNICCQYKKSTNQQFMFVNGTLNNSRTANNTHLLQNLNLCICGNVLATTNYCWKGYLSNLIFENKLWTVTEVQDYYNQTKSNYGL